MKRYDVEVVPHLVCGGLDRHTIENILIDLNFLDIDNVMALRGDPAPGERFFTPTRGGHAYCSDLVRQISDMNRGVYLDELQQNPIPPTSASGSPVIRKNITNRPTSRRTSGT